MNRQDPHGPPKETVSSWLSRPPQPLPQSILKPSSTSWEIKVSSKRGSLFLFPPNLHPHTTTPRTCHTKPIAGVQRGQLPVLPVLAQKEPLLNLHRLWRLELRSWVTPQHPAAFNPPPPPP